VLLNLIHTRFQPGDQSDKNFYLTVSTVYPPREKSETVETVEESKGVTPVTRLKPGVNEMKPHPGKAEPFRTGQRKSRKGVLAVIHS
jgi:hypothetical protein